MSSFLRSFSIFSFFTLISRLFGFARDVINARVLGVGHLSDAFFVAFRLPNLFRSLFAEGAMNSAFIPIYSKKLENGEEDAPHFVGKIIFLFGVFLLLFCIIAEISMPFILSAIAPGFDNLEGSEYFLIAVELGKIMFPFLFFIGLTAILCCAAQSHHKFMPSSAYPIIMNLVLIIASFLPFLTPAYILSYGVVVSGIMQLIFLIFSIKYYRISILFPKFDKNFFNYDVKHFFRKLLPSILTCSVTRIGITIDTMIASTTVGAVSYIYYSDRLYQLPLSLIGVTISTVLLPSLSKIIAKLKKHKDENDHESHDELSKRFSLTQARIFEFAFILVLPSTIGLYLMSEDICSLLFSSTKFGKEAIIETGSFLALLSLALPANILNNILNSILFSHHITKFATKAATYSLIVNLIVNFGLFYLFKYGYKSIAIATIVSSYFNCFMLLIFCKKNNYVSTIEDFSRIKYIFFTNIVLIFIIEILNILKNYFLIQFSFKWKIFVVLEIFLVMNIYFLILGRKDKFKIQDFKKLFID
jgi:putative peptidoglycan lipid II flippase